MHYLYSKKSQLAALTMAALLLVAGCDEVSRSAFGGIKGAVGYPGISDCQVEVYDALRFEALESDAGLIASGRTNLAGRFSIELSDRHLGRPLIVVARPDDRAMYRDFGAVGTPDVPFDQPRQPWVSVLNEWLGGEAIISVNPLTTLAFHSLMRLPAEDVGPGLLRFDRHVVNAVAAATAANFGIRSNLAAENPAPPAGPMFAAQSPFFRERNGRSISYNYVCLQLAKAANEFVATTIDPADSSLDFYEALFRDAQDGVLDGMYFGAPIAFLDQLPNVVGRDSDGASRLLRWISGVSLTLQEQEFAGAAHDQRFSPTPDEMLKIQDAATGALRPTRIERIDVSNFPYSGNVELTIHGSGLRRTDQFIFRRGTDIRGDFIVDRESVGVDGQFLFHSDTMLRMRIPDFAVTTKTVPSTLRVPENADFRVLRLILRNHPELINNNRSIEHELTASARVTNRTEPLLIHTEIVRVTDTETRLASSGNNIYDDATDPALLDPAFDNVYELRVRVANPGPHEILDLRLDFNLSSFSQMGTPVVVDFFGGGAPGRAVVFEDPLPMMNLASGDVARLDYRFVFLDSAIPSDLLTGAPVRFTPVLSGFSAGPGNPEVSTGDVIGFNRSAELAPVEPDATPQLETPLVVLPASVTAGETFEIRIELTAVPVMGAAMRSLRVEGVRLELDFDGELIDLNLTDAFFRTESNTGLAFLSLRGEGQAGSALPLLLTQSAANGSVTLVVRTADSVSGPLTIVALAKAIDTATGTTVPAASAPAVTSIVP